MGQTSNVVQHMVHVAQAAAHSAINQGAVQAIMAQFKELKKGTPTYGAILLNQDWQKALLVQFMAKGNDAGSWSFPRGKLEGRDRGDIFECAVREVRFAWPSQRMHAMRMRLRMFRATCLELVAMPEILYHSCQHCSSNIVGMPARTACKARHLCISQ